MQPLGRRLGERYGSLSERGRAACEDVPWPATAVGERPRRRGRPPRLRAEEPQTTARAGPGARAAGEEKAPVTSDGIESLELEGQQIIVTLGRTGPGAVRRPRQMSFGSW